MLDDARNIRKAVKVNSVSRALLSYSVKVFSLRICNTNAKYKVGIPDLIIITSLAMYVHY